MLASEEHQEAQPSPNGLMYFKTQILTMQQTMSQVYHTVDAHKLRVCTWVEDQHSLSLQQPSSRDLRKTSPSTPSLVVCAELELTVHNPAKPMTSPPAEPQHTAGDHVSSLDWFKHSLASHLLSCKVPLYVQHAQGRTNRS